VDLNLEITLNKAERIRRALRREENRQMWQDHFRRQAITFATLAEAASEKAELYERRQHE